MLVNGKECSEYHGLHETGNPGTPFSTCFHRGDTSCAVLLVVSSTKAFVDASAVEELFEHGLSRDLSSSPLLDSKQLGEVEQLLGRIDVPLYLQRTQAGHLAQLGLALLSYVAEHPTDKGRVQLSSEDRVVIIDMVEQIDRVLAEKHRELVRA